MYKRVHRTNWSFVVSTTRLRFDSHSNVTRERDTRFPDEDEGVRVVPEGGGCVSGSGGVSREFQRRDGGSTTHSSMFRPHLCVTCRCVRHHPGTLPHPSLTKINDRLSLQGNATDGRFGGKVEGFVGRVSVTGVDGGSMIMVELTYVDVRSDTTPQPVMVTDFQTKGSSRSR